MNPDLYWVERPDPEYQVWFYPSGARHQPQCWYRGFQNRAMFLCSKWKFMYKWDVRIKEVI